MKTGYLIAGVGFMLAALFAAFACWRSFSLMQASSSWEKTTGNIERSDVHDNSVGRKQKFQAAIEYRYSVGGHNYRGSRVRFADTTGSSEENQRAIAGKYPLGASVDVYYDPHDPQQSVLEPGGGARAYGLILPPLILAVIGGIVLIDGRRKSLNRY